MRDQNRACQEAEVLRGPRYQAGTAKEKRRRADIRKVRAPCGGRKSDRTAHTMIVPLRKKCGTQEAGWKGEALIVAKYIETVQAQNTTPEEVFVLPLDSREGGAGPHANQSGRKVRNVGLGAKARETSDENKKHADPFKRAQKAAWVQDAENPHGRGERPGYNTLSPSIPRRVFDKRASKRGAKKATRAGWDMGRKGDRAGPRSLLFGERYSASLEQKTQKGAAY